MTTTSKTEGREALARVIDPDSCALSDDPRYDNLPEEARTTIRRRSLEIADRIIDSGLMASFTWDRREYFRARDYIKERTSLRGYCYSVSDALDGYFMHDPKCGFWPDGAIGGSNCIKERR